MAEQTSLQRRPSQRALAVLMAATLLFILIRPVAAIAGQTPVWRTPADTLVVLSTGVSNDLPFAIVRDASMKGHNTFCVTIGAHIGNLQVASIGPSGVVLTNGRLLAPASASSPAIMATTQKQ
jgi:hypothetical protein